MSDKKIQRFTRPSSQSSTSRISLSYFFLFALLLVASFISVYRFGQRSVSVHFTPQPAFTPTVYIPSDLTPSPQFQNDLDIVETFFGIDQSNMGCEQQSDGSLSCSSGGASPPKLVTLPPDIPPPPSPQPP